MRLADVESPVQLPRRDRIDLRLAGKQPSLGPGLAPVVPQKIEQIGRQHDLAILPTLTLHDMDEHPVAVDIARGEIANLGSSQTCTVGNAERSTILKPRPGCYRQKPGNFLGAEHRGQLARLRAELHVPLHLLAPAGHREKETQRGDARVVDRGRDAHGARVEKSELGWVLGAETYGDHTAFAMHQDQVLELPSGAANVMSSPRCKIARIDYDFPAMSVQYHPEFSAAFMESLLELYETGEIHPELIEKARATLGTQTHVDRIAEEFARFFRSHRRNPDNPVV